MDDLTPGYVSPYGKPGGLAKRLADWAERLPLDHSYPWVGTGILEDLKLAAAILSKREWLEAMRLSDDPEAQQFAAELLAVCDEWDAAEDACAYVRGIPGEDSALPPVDTIEKLDAAALAAQRDYGRVRDVLVERGALAHDDTETPVGDLVRALLS